MTITEDGPSADAPPPPSETSELAYSAGQAAWISLMSLVALVSLALSITAIVVANSDDGGTAAPASDGGGGPVTEAEVAASEFAFDPAEVELVADQEVTVTLSNDGSVEHNWTVIEQGAEVTSEDEIPDAPTAGEVPTVAAGEQGTGTLTLPAGTYQVVCTITGHFAAGMEGTVTATAGAGGAATTAAA